MTEVFNPNQELNLGKTQLERAFPSDSYILGTTAVHGFEPPIIAIGVGIKINEDLEASGLGRRPIIIPRIYGEKLDVVLKDEFPDYQDQIFLSDELATILTLTEFTTAGYQAHLENVAAYQPQVKKMLAEFLSKPFKATSLDGTSEITIHPEQKPIELNIGANVNATSEAHSIFPVRLSDLLAYIRRTPELLESYNPDTLRRVERIAREMEENHKTTQISDFHTLSAEDWFNPDGIIFVPHLKDPKTPPTDVDTSSEKGAIYVNVSGGGMGKDAAQLQSMNLAQKGYTILAPQSIKWDFATTQGPRALYLKDANGRPFVKAFLMRPGFGSIWHAISAELPIGYLPGDIFESPEMHANYRALKGAGMGHVFTARGDIMDVFKDMPEKIREYKEDMYRRLGLTQGTSGVQVTARNIIKNEANV